MTKIVLTQKFLILICTEILNSKIVILLLFTRGSPLVNFGSLQIVREPWISHFRSLYIFGPLYLLLRKFPIAIPSTSNNSIVIAGGINCCSNYWFLKFRRMCGFSPDKSSPYYVNTGYKLSCCQ